MRSTSHRGWADGLADRLGSAPSWRERFGLVDDALLELASRGREPDDFVDWMWGQIEASGGTARVSDLVDRTGWSHRHVTTRFSEQIGITPKAAVGVVRFVNACADLGRLPLAEVATRHGYADQSHLTREVVRYAGEPPTALLPHNDPPRTPPSAPRLSSHGGRNHTDTGLSGSGANEPDAPIVG